MSYLSTRVSVPCPNLAGCPGRSAPGGEGRGRASLCSHCPLQSQKLPEGGGLALSRLLLWCPRAVARGSGRPVSCLGGGTDGESWDSGRFSVVASLRCVSGRNSGAHGAARTAVLWLKGRWVRARHRAPAAGPPPRPFLLITHFGHSQERTASFSIFLERVSGALTDTHVQGGIGRGQGRISRGGRCSRPWDHAPS